MYADNHLSIQILNQFLYRLNCIFCAFYIHFWFYPFISYQFYMYKFHATCSFRMPV